MLQVTGHWVGNGELSKMGSVESHCQEFRIRQEMRKRFLSGQVDTPSVSLGGGGACDLGNKKQ